MQKRVNLRVALIVRSANHFPEPTSSLISAHPNLMPIFPSCAII